LLSTPLRKAYGASPDPLAGFMRATSKRREGKGEGKRRKRGRE